MRIASFGRFSVADRSPSVKWKFFTPSIEYDVSDSPFTTRSPEENVITGLSANRKLYLLPALSSTVRWVGAALICVMPKINAADAKNVLFSPI